MNKKIQITFAASLLAMAGAAVAADAGSGFYGGLSVGQSTYRADKGGIDNSLSAGAGVTDLSSTLDNKDTGYKLRLGYSFNPYLAVEGGYMNFGKMKYSGAFTSPAAGDAGGTIKAQGINVDVVGKLPLTSELSAFGKAGVLFSKVSSDASANVAGLTVSDSATSRKAVPGLGLGLEYALARNVSLRGEWERYYKLGNDSTGKGDVDLLSAGLNVKF